MMGKLLKGQKAQFTVLLEILKVLVIFLQLFWIKLFFLSTVKTKATTRVMTITTNLTKAQMKTTKMTKTMMIFLY